MDEVLRKYNNMQKLCLSINSTNDWVISLQNASLEIFLHTIRIRINENKNYGVDDFYKNILEISKLNEKEINDDDKAKIKLYIEYFIKITRAII